MMYSINRKQYDVNWFKPVYKAYRDSSYSLYVIQKKMKKITTLVLSLVLVLAMSITAFAATPNDDVKAALKEAGVTGEYYDQAVKFLANNELTAEQAEAVVYQVKEAKKNAGDAKSVADLSADQISKIKTNITIAANAVGAKVSFADKTVSVTDAKGTQYTVSSNPVKATGATTTATVAGIAVLAMGLVACGVAVSKKRFA